jgi:hypothetical protein
VAGARRIVVTGTGSAEARKTASPTSLVVDAADPASAL